MPLEARVQIVQAFACRLVSCLKCVFQSDLCRPSVLSRVGLPTHRSPGELHVVLAQLHPPWLSLWYLEKSPAALLSDCRCLFSRDTMDSVKQSAALCLLRLYRTSPDLVPMGDWTSRVVHLLNDQHLVSV